MRKTVILRLFVLMLLAAMLLSACSAAPVAGEKMLEEAAAAASAAPAASPAPSVSPAPEAAPAASPSPAPAAESPAPGEEALKHVEAATVDELLKAIGPDTVITLTSRSYDLTDALGYGNFGGTYYTWDSAFDGFELRIENVSGLTIRADRPRTEILTNPRYACVLKFTDCSNITLEGFTAGHSAAAGICTGAVIRTEGCRNVLIRGCDLYGCGTYGLELFDSSGVHAVDTTIRDCSYGALSAQTCRDLLLDGCSIFGIESFGGILSMTGCRDCACINSLIRDCRGSCLTECYYVRDFYLAGCEISKNELDGMFLATDYPFVLEGCAFKGNKLTHGWYNDTWQKSERAVDAEGRQYSDEQLASLSLTENVQWEAPEERVPTVEAPSPDAEGVTHVSNVDEFLAAIAPGAVIYLEDGVYDLSAAEAYGGTGSEWYYWMSCYDGPGLVIRGVDNLTITAAGSHRARIAAQPRYCEVLTFENCSGIRLQNFTAGHTQAVTSCAGGVLTFMHSTDVTIEDCSLFGCGIMGVTANGCRGMEIRYTEIYDCDAGAFYFISSREIAVKECNIHDIGSYIYQLYECKDVTADGKAVPDGLSN